MPGDLIRYRTHPCLTGLSDVEKDEIIHMIANTLKPFVDRAFGTHPVQLALQTRAKKLTDPSPARAIVNGNSNTKETEQPAPVRAEEGGIP